MTEQSADGLTRRHLLGLTGKVAAGTAVGLGALSALEAKANSLFVDINDDNFKSEILDYEGPALVLFYDSNFTRAPPSGLMLKVFEGLAKNLANKPLENYDGKPIKFALFDADKYNRLPLTTQQKIARMKDRYGIDEFPVTAMYAKGEKLDMLKGGPKTEKLINDWITFLEDKWISTNITNPNGQFYLRFGYSGRLTKVNYKSG
ncbi:hypothetical protein HY487_01470 [Candidatus Woesearchaeota archaeon]|nr:hypothetical protein [Candidatus Woesearchaeota archaeon]